MMATTPSGIRIESTLDLRKRRISLEEDFMNWGRNDIMYAYLLNCASYREQDNKLYIVKEEYMCNIREEIMELCGYSTLKSLKNNMEKWIQTGLIEEGTIDYGKKTFDAYIFKNWDENGKYQLVNADMLLYLTETRNKNCIRIYTYLLNKWLFKYDYEFTFTELREAMGYSSNKNSYKTVNDRIKNILNSFEREGIMKCESYYKKVYSEAEGKVVSLPVHKVTYVAKSTLELKKVTNYVA